MMIGEWSDGFFLGRPNRFLAQVRLGREKVQAHLPDPGRLTELLVPGAKVRLLPSSREGRRTAWTLIGVECPAGWVNVDSRLPNQLFEEALREGRLPEFSGVSEWRREYRYGGSVIDFLLAGDPPCLAEVKGCTLVVGETALFPDAPTSRGTRHLGELEAARARGMRSCVVFVVKHPAAREFRANRDTDPLFAEALASATAAGVEALAYLAAWRGREIRLGERMPVRTG
jgi:sugar fermentation stimulation protein A